MGLKCLQTVLAEENALCLNCLWKCSQALHNLSQPQQLILMGSSGLNCCASAGWDKAALSTAGSVELGRLGTVTCCLYPALLQRPEAVSLSLSKWRCLQCQREELEDWGCVKADLQYHRIISKNPRMAFDGKDLKPIQYHPPAAGCMALPKGKEECVGCHAVTHTNIDAS